MAKKRTTPHDDDASDAELAHTLRVAAQHIWLAGLGALAKTQAESAKILGALKTEGRHTGRSARQRVAGLTEDVGRITTQAARGASGAVERLDHLFDTRIMRTLRQLGVPTAEEMRAISDRLDALESHTGTAPRKRSGAARTAARPSGGKTVARKANPKSAAAKAVAKKRPPARRRVAG